jgi:hypothetical protein
VVIAYAEFGIPVLARKAAVDAILMIFPFFPGIMSQGAAWQQKQMPLNLLLQ